MGRLTMKEEYREVIFSLPKPPSLNKFYAGKHFAIRMKYKKDYNVHVKKQLDDSKKYFKGFNIRVKHDDEFIEKDEVLVTLKLNNCTEQL